MEVVGFTLLCCVLLWHQKLDVSAKRLHGTKELVYQADRTGSNISSVCTMFTASGTFSVFSGEQSVHTYVVNSSQSPTQTGMFYEHETSEEKQLDVRVLHNKLWASILLQDNLVTVFGYILNLPNNPLTSDMYYSLFQIYNSLRFRHINTLEILPILNTLKPLNMQKQFMVIFSELRRFVPRYLNDEVAIWIEGIRNKFVDIDNILKYNDNYPIVGILTGIPDEIFECLKQPLLFSQHTIIKVSSKISDIMGSLFGKIFSALDNGSLKLSQTIFAAILMHTPLNSVVPQADETKRYIVDYLRNNGCQNWNEIISFINSTSKQSPFQLITEVLTLIAEREIDENIRYTARYIIPYISDLSPTFVNKYYSVAAELLSTPKIDFTQLLSSTIISSEYPQYVVEKRDKIVSYIVSGLLDVDAITRGFNRFDHNRPIDVLIAFLTRILRRRSASIPDVVISDVKNLQLYFIFRSFFCYLSPKLPGDLIDVPALMEAFDESTFPKDIIDTSEDIMVQLSKENINWTSVITNTSPVNCSTARHCVLHLIRKVIDGKQISNQVLLTQLTEFVGKFKLNGELISPKLAKESNIISKETELPTQVDVNVELEGLHRRNGAHSKSSIYSSNSNYDNPLPFNTDNNRYAMPYGPASTKLPDNNIQLFEPPHNTSGALYVTLDSPNVNPSLSNNKNTETELDSLEELEAWDKNVTLFYNETYVNISLEPHNNASITDDVLLTSMYAPLDPDLIESHHVDQDDDKSSLYGSMFLDGDQFVMAQDTYTYKYSYSEVVSSDMKSGVHFTSIDPSWWEFPPNYEHPEKSLPYSETDPRMSYIRSFLSHPDFYSLISSSFNPRFYKTNLDFLRAILGASLESNHVRSDIVLYNGIENYLNYLHKYYPEANVKLDPLLSALPRDESLDGLRKYEIIRHFLSETDTISLYLNINLSSFPTKGSALKYILEDALTLDHVKDQPDLVRAIEFYKDKVLVKGPGSNTVQWMIYNVTEEEFDVDVSDILTALDTRNLSEEANRATDILIKYINEEYEPGVHFNGFDFRRYKTNGELLKAAFEFVLEHNTAPVYLKRAIRILLPYVQLTGPGALTVTFHSNTSFS